MTRRTTAAELRNGDELYSRITVDPEKLHGLPCIRGLRIPVYLVVGFVAAGMTTAEILEQYPDLEAADIRAALEYAAALTREEVVPLEVFA